MILTGLARIGRDVEVHYTPGGNAVANMSLAFNYGKKDGGTRPSQWIEASLWGKRAELLAQYLLKGTQVDVVLDEPHIEEYEGKNGKGSKLVARVLGIEFAGSRRDSESEPSQRSEPAAQPSPRGGGASGFDDMDDDIPF